MSEEIKYISLLFFFLIAFYCIIRAIACGGSVSGTTDAVGDFASGCDDGGCGMSPRSTQNGEGWAIPNPPISQS